MTLSASHFHPAPLVMVVGSLNIDWTWHLNRLPSPGETILAKSVHRQFGGKGANQAIAAARMGGRVTFVGAVGNDQEGEEYRGYLEQEGIEVNDILVGSNHGTGAANIYLDQHGENSIVVDSGANRALTFEQVRMAVMRPGALPKILLVQLETPLEVVLETLHLARKLKIRTILNPSPIHPDFPWGKVPVDTVIVNQHECLHCFAHSVDTLEDLSDAERIALLDHYQLQNMIITQGSAPTLHLSRSEQFHVPCLPVTPVDTVGAGDTFTGCLAVQLAEEQAWREAIWNANVAAALATLGHGAQTSMPRRKEVLEAASRSGTDSGSFRRSPQTGREDAFGLPAQAARAFTLLELLVVITIISIVAALLYPVTSQVRDNAKETSSLNNLRFLGVTVMHFLMDNNNRYPGPGEGGGTRPYPRIAAYTDPPAELIINGTSESSGTPYRRHRLGYQLPQFRTPFTPTNLYTPGQAGFVHEFVGLYGINTELTYYPLRKDNMWGIHALSIQNPAKTIMAGEHYALPLNGAAIAGHLNPATPFLGTTASSDGIASNVGIRRKGIPKSVNAITGPACVLFCDGHVKIIQLSELLPWPASGASNTPYTFYP